MPVERSAGAVIFRDLPEGRTYLLLHHQPMENKRASKKVAGHWSFPKGHIEKGETTEEAVRREVREETGIKTLMFIPGFKQTIRYFVNYNGEKRLKFVAFFLGSTTQENIIISHEHQGFAWLPYKEAIATISYPSDKKVLKAAEAFITKQE